MGKVGAQAGVFCHKLALDRARQRPHKPFARTPAMGSLFILSICHPSLMTSMICVE